MFRNGFFAAFDLNMHKMNIIAFWHGYMYPRQPGVINLPSLLTQTNMRYICGVLGAVDDPTLLSCGSRPRRRSLTIDNRQ